MKMLAVWTTVATEKDAKRIAERCVSQRLSACAQLSSIESFYEWKGSVQQESEIRIVLKTTEDRYGDLVALIRELHPYELPAIFAFEVRHASEAYHEWVRAQTRAGS